VSELNTYVLGPIAEIATNLGGQHIGFLHPSLPVLLTTKAESSFRKDVILYIYYLYDRQTPKENFYIIERSIVRNLQNSITHKVPI
jgi:hypothetical protein